MNSELSPWSLIAIELYPLLCVFIPGIIYQIIWYRRQPSDQKPTRINILWRNIFLLYLTLVMSVVSIASIWEFGKYDTLIRTNEINLTPFQSGGYLTYILNAVMFMPLGFLVPCLWPKYRQLFKTMGVGAIFSLLIELGQLFNRRKTDIDDLLMNVLGTLIGFGLWWVFSKISKFEFKNDNQTDEPLVYILLAILGTFLLFNWRWFLRLVA